MKITYFGKNIQGRFDVYKTSTRLKFLWKQKYCNVVTDLMI